MTEYLRPANYYRGRQRRLRVIVIHTMETPETTGRALWCARWFAGLEGPAPVASAHACIDDRSVIRCLPASDTAFAAPGANADGYQIEHAGYMRQSAADWADAFSSKQLALSAAHAREIALANSIPFVHLTNEELAAEKSGFIGHDQASSVYKQSDHTDPGPAFPWDHYLAMVRQTSNPTPSRKAPDMQLVTSKATTTQWLLFADGTLVALPSSEFAQVAQTMVAGTLTGINARELDVVKDILTRAKAARK